MRRGHEAQKKHRERTMPVICAEASWRPIIRVSLGSVCRRPECRDQSRSRRNTAVNFVFLAAASAAAKPLLRAFLNGGACERCRVVGWEMAQLLSRRQLQSMQQPAQLRASAIVTMRAGARIASAKRCRNQIMQLLGEKDWSSRWLGATFATKARPALRPRQRQFSR
jgi:hypothetical protein